MSDSYSIPFYRHGVFWLFAGLISFMLIIILVTELWAIPKANEDWQATKYFIDNMSCKDLGKYLVFHSTDYVSDGGYSKEYKYADSKWHTGDCHQ